MIVRLDGREKLPPLALISRRVLEITSPRVCLLFCARNRRIRAVGSSGDGSDSSKSLACWREEATSR